MKAAIDRFTRVEDLPELPAVCYLTEVSHLSGGKAYCLGGGFYIDPIFPDYDVKAIVADEPTTAASALRSVEIPPPSMIDYYAMIDAEGANAPKPGDTAVFGFRGQAFVTRAYVVGVSGISRASRASGMYTVNSLPRPGPSLLATT